MTDDLDLVGVAEIAERLGTTEKVVATWQARGWPAGRPRKAEPPKCEAIISGRFSVYRWAEVERWARESGRLQGTSKPRRKGPTKAGARPSKRSGGIAKREGGAR